MTVNEISRKNIRKVMSQQVLSDYAAPKDWPPNTPWFRHHQWIALKIMDLRVCVLSVKL